MDNSSNLSGMMGDDFLILTLRTRVFPLKPDLSTDIFQWMRLPKVFEFIPKDPPKTRDELRDRFAFITQEPIRKTGEIWINLAVSDREDGGIIGLIEATIIDGKVFLAYFFDPAHWGTGLAFEAVSAVLTDLSTRGAKEFIAEICIANIRSVRLVERLGFKLVEVRNSDEASDLKEADEVVYRLTTKGQ